MPNITEITIKEEDYDQQVVLKSANGTIQSTADSATLRTPRATAVPSNGGPVADRDYAATFKEGGISKGIERMRFVNDPNDYIFTRSEESRK